MTLRVTYTGRAIAKSGLLPSTAAELLTFFGAHAEQFSALNEACSQSELEDCDDFAFVLIHAVLSSTEFGRSDIPRRYLPYQLLAAPLTGPQGQLRDSLFTPSQADAINGAVLAWRWIKGAEMRQLESLLGIRSGALTAMFADAANIIRGLADILFAATSVRSTEELPTSLRAEWIAPLRNLIPTIRRIAVRLDTGLPDDVVWMRTIVDNGSRVLTRNQIVKLREAGLLSPTDLLDPGKFPLLLDSLGPRSPANTAFAQLVQQATRTWRIDERNRLIESQRKRLPAECRDVLLRFYRSLETEFEDVLGEIFECFSIEIEGRDDNTKTSFPDFVVTPVAPQTLSIECKSKTVGEAVTFNDATDVIRKAGVNGFGSTFKVTVCQPYISPDVPRKLTNCPDLCVVNVEDLAEAFVRLKQGSLSMQAFSDWLGRPGQALREHLVTAKSPVVG